MKPEPLKWKRRCPECLETETATAADQCERGCCNRIVFLDEDVQAAVRWLKLALKKKACSGIEIHEVSLFRRAYELMDEAFEDVMKK